MHDPAVSEGHKIDRSSDGRPVQTLDGGQPVFVRAVPEHAVVEGDVDARCVQQVLNDYVCQLTHHPHIAKLSMFPDPTFFWWMASGES